MSLLSCSSRAESLDAVGSGQAVESAWVDLARMFRVWSVMELPQPVPDHFYSNNLCRSKKLNSLIIQLNQITAFLFRHVINASLQNTETHQSRLLYHQLKASCPPPRRLQSQKHGPEEPRLIWPRSSERLYAIVLIFELIFYISYCISIWVLVGSSNKELALITARNLNTIHKPIGMINEINSLYSEYGDGLEKQLYSNLTDKCRSRLAEFLASRYDKFYVWNSSVGFRDYPLLNDYYLVEQSYALQLYAPEVLLFCHSIGCLLIFCGILGSLATIRFTYDVTPLLFIYDPTYCAFRVKAKLMHYLTDVRLSFINYWSIFVLNQDYSLGRRGGQSLTEPDVESVEALDDNSAWDDKRLRNIDLVYAQARAKVIELAGPEARQSLNSHSARFKGKQKPSHGEGHSLIQTALFDEHYHKAVAIDPDSIISLQPRQYVDFIPDSRSQSFRRVIMIKWPSFVLFVSTFLTFILILLFFFFVHLNSDAVSLNRELQEFLNGSSSAEPAELKRVARAHCAGVAQVTELVRRTLVSHLSAGLLATAKSGGNSNQGQVDEDSRKEMVIRALKPVWQPSVGNWIRPSMGAALTGTLCTLYYTIVFSVLCDLCFWMFGLRMKLSICRIVLKYYAEIQNEQKELARECGSQRNWPLGQRVPCKQSLEPPHDGSRMLGRATIALPTLYSLQEESVRLSQSQHRAGEPAFGASVHGGAQLDLSDQQHWEPGQVDVGEHQLIMNQTDILMSSSLGLEDDSYMLARVLRVSNSTTPTTYLNLGCWQVLIYIISNRAGRNQMCRLFAKRLIIADHLYETRAQQAKRCHSGSRLGANTNNNHNHNHNIDIDSLNRIDRQQHLSDAFLVSAYLEFRLFIDQIENCRNSINIITGYAIFHSINIIFSSLVTNYARSRYGFLFVGYTVANLTLISTSFFQSQCTKLMPPIYSILASSMRVNESLRHLAMLWQRSLHDLVGPKSKFCFNFYSVRISYAVALKFNFGIISLYILALDRFKARI